MTRATSPARLLRALCAALMTLMSVPVVAQIDGLAIDNILVSKQDDEAIIRILPRCQMRYLVHSPPKGGASLRIRVTLGRDCANAFDETISERYSPPGSATADLVSVAFDATSRWNGNITLDFARPREFTVAAGANGWIEVRLDASREANEFSSAEPLPLPPAAPPPVTPADRIDARRSEGEAANRGPSQRRTWEARPETFAVQVGIFEDPRAALGALASQYPELPVSTRAMAVAGRDWSEVLIGPFATAQAAENALAQLDGQFPDSWVRVVQAFDAERFDRNNSDLFDDVTATPVVAGETLSEAELAGRMQLARKALLSGDYATAISNYRDVLAVADHPYRATAREYLGVAFERNQQTDAALAEYRSWLNEYTDSADSARVAARLDGLRTAIDEPRGGTFELDGQARNVSTTWSGGLSQIYRRDVAQFVDDGDGRLTAAALYNYADLNVVRRGERFDAIGRFSGSYIYDTNSDARLNRDTGWVSDAFLKLTDNSLGLDATVGRQRANGTGVLSRFDGLRLDYRWRDNISVGGVAGVPIDTARFAGNRNRLLYGANVLFSDVLASTDAQVYAIRQTTDGISDREAIGAELFYTGERINVTGLLDYDLSFAVLNSALVNVNWQATADLVVNALVETGRNPAITTRNSLAGRDERTVDDLLDTFREGQVRQLALDRTPEATQFNLGAAYAFS